MDWISVADEKKPSVGELVILFTDKGVGFGKFDAIYNTFKSITISGNVEYSKYSITYWMPLPEPPQPD